MFKKKFIPDPNKDIYISSKDSKDSNKNYNNITLSIPPLSQQDIQDKELKSPLEMPLPQQDPLRSSVIDENDSKHPAIPPIKLRKNYMKHTVGASLEQFENRRLLKEIDPELSHSSNTLYTKTINADLSLLQSLLVIQCKSISIKICSDTTSSDICIYMPWLRAKIYSSVLVELYKLKFSIANLVILSCFNNPFNTWIDKEQLNNTLRLYKDLHDDIQLLSPIYSGQLDKKCMYTILFCTHPIKTYVHILHSGKDANNTVRIECLKMNGYLTQESVPQLLVIIRDYMSKIDEPTDIYGQGILPSEINNIDFKSIYSQYQEILWKENRLDWLIKRYCMHLSLRKAPLSSPPSISNPYSDYLSMYSALPKDISQKNNIYPSSINKSTKKSKDYDLYPNYSSIPVSTTNNVSTPFFMNSKNINKNKENHDNIKNNMDQSFVQNKDKNEVIDIDNNSIFSSTNPSLSSFSSLPANSPEYYHHIESMPQFSYPSSLPPLNSITSSPSLPLVYNNQINDYSNKFSNIPSYSPISYIPMTNLSSYPYIYSSDINRPRINSLDNLYPSLEYIPYISQNGISSYSPSYPTYRGLSLYDLHFNPYSIQQYIPIMASNSSSPLPSSQSPLYSNPLSLTTLLELYSIYKKEEKKMEQFLKILLKNIEEKSSVLYPNIDVTLYIGKIRIQLFDERVLHHDFRLDDLDFEIVLYDTSEGRTQLSLRSLAIYSFLSDVSDPRLLLPFLLEHQRQTSPVLIITSELIPPEDHLFTLRSFVVSVHPLRLQISRSSIQDIIKYFNTSDVKLIKRKPTSLDASQDPSLIPSLDTVKDTHLYIDISNPTDSSKDTSSISHTSSFNSISTTQKDQEKEKEKEKKDIKKRMSSKDVSTGMENKDIDTNTQENKKLAIKKKLTKRCIYIKYLRINRIDVFCSITDTRPLPGVDDYSMIKVKFKPLVFNAKKSPVSDLAITVGKTLLYDLLSQTGRTVTSVLTVMANGLGFSGFVGLLRAPAPIPKYNRVEEKKNSLNTTQDKDINKSNIYTKSDVNNRLLLLFNSYYEDHNYGEKYRYEEIIHTLEDVKEDENDKESPQFICYCEDFKEKKNSPMSRILFDQLTRFCPI